MNLGCSMQTYHRFVLLQCIHWSTKWSINVYIRWLDVYKLASPSQKTANILAYAIWVWVIHTKSLLITSCSLRYSIARWRTRNDGAKNKPRIPYPQQSRFAKNSFNTPHRHLAEASLSVSKNMIKSGMIPNILAGMILSLFSSLYCAFSFQLESAQNSRTPQKR
jgi:hypothetical protein